MKSISVLIFGTALFVTAHSVQAQVKADPRGATNITSNGRQFDIKGGKRSRNGKNQFHSFDRFGLNKGQTANFISDPSTSNILGRVVGGNPSVINGLIKVTGSNANLFLMNPAGMLFGPNARLDVPAAFTATTANGIGLGSKWFSASGDNNYQDLIGNPTSFAFTNQSPGSIVNSAELIVKPTESITLLGGSVVNTGEVKSEGGQVTLTAVPGKNLVRLSQDSHLLSLAFEPISDSSTLPNPQAISPASLPALLTGGDIQNAGSLNLNAQGQLELNGSGLKISDEGGTVVASGKLDTSATTAITQAGSVFVLGSHVNVIDSNINASGINGGGKVLIGGDYKGKGTVPNALSTYINKKSTISASAIDSNNGGQVIIWSDTVTSFFGEISAEGGLQRGDGGFVEVSGKENLVFRGDVNVTAQSGRSGSLLLDPNNITIVDSQTAENDEEINDNTIFADDQGDTFTISTTTLEDLEGNITLEASNDIVIEKLNSNPLNLKTTSGQTVTFDAGGLVLMKDTVNDTITTNGGNISITADGGVTLGEISTTQDNFNFGRVDIITSQGAVNIRNIRTGGINNDDGKGINIHSSGTINIPGTPDIILGEDSVGNLEIMEGDPGIDSAGSQEIVTIKSKTGDIITGNIRIGIGGLEIDAPNGIVQIVGDSFFAVGTGLIPNTVEELSDIGILEFLNAKNISGVDSTDTIDVPVFPDGTTASIEVITDFAAEPANINITYGDSDNAITHIDRTVFINGNEGRILVQGDSNVPFVSGPTFEPILDNGDPFVIFNLDINQGATSNNPNDFEAVTAENFICDSTCRPTNGGSLVFNLQGATPLEIPEGSSGLSSSITQTNGGNRTFVGSTTPIVFIPDNIGGTKPPVIKPPVTKTPVTKTPETKTPETKTPETKPKPENETELEVEIDCSAYAEKGSLDLDAITPEDCKAE